MKIHFVDAFTERPFAGNPAAVVLLDNDFPSDERLQRLAAELNLTVTAYAHPLGDPEAEADWALRWFAPAAELRVCGHATLATAHVLRSTGALDGRVRFATQSGVLTASAAASASAASSEDRITLDFPTAPLTPTELPASAAGALLGTPVRSAWLTGPTVGKLLLEVEDEAAVRTLMPDPHLQAGFGTRGVIVTAAASGTDTAYDYVSRCFYPGVGSGAGEDPVTGSAHTALAPFWSRRLGRDELVGFQASARGGQVCTTVCGERTLLGGHAVTVLEAELRVPL